MINNKQKKSKRKICVVLTNRVHYARQKDLIFRLRRDKRVELQLVIGGSIVVPKYGDRIYREIRDNNFPICEVLHTVVEGGNNIAMAKTAGLALLEFTTTFGRLSPDVVLIRGDRFEMLAAAIAAAYLNIPVAHIEGGDLSGTIDESVRHAITKLAHIHFTTHEEAKDRVVRMGEDPDYVFNFGSPDAEFARLVKKKPKKEAVSKTATGADFDSSEQYILVMYHPVTTESDNYEHAKLLLETVSSLKEQVLWFWPNMDAGTDDVSKAIRMFREHKKGHRLTFIKELPPEDFISLMKYSSCVVGNSSSGIKETSVLGVPAVDIGSRQQNRLRSKNVLKARFSRKDIIAKIEKQIAHGPYEPSDIYYRKDTSRNIADTLVKIKLYVQKKFNDNV